MAELKRIPKASTAAALDKAHHYRLLNEPFLAESICLDVLEVDPCNQRALIILLLALTDQFPTRRHHAQSQAMNLIPQLDSEFDRVYYEGIIHERWASDQIESGIAPRSAVEWLGKAMKCFESAERLTAGQNPDPILRWNTCARLGRQVVISEAESDMLSREIEAEYGDHV